jgi:CheY-like chemotaxis protein
MDIDGAVKLIEAISKLIGVLVWPFLLIYFSLRFAPELREFVKSIGDISFKFLGIEWSFRQRQAEAVAALRAAAVSKSGVGDDKQAIAHEARLAADVVADAVTPKVVRQARRSRVLWVDDKPAGNINERHALEAVGITIVNATSTEDALQRLSNDSFDLIISDMARPGDSRGGYTLLDKLRALGDRTPVIIYTNTRKPREEAQQKRLFGYTNRANELFELALSALGRKMNES